MNQQLSKNNLGTNCTKESIGYCTTARQMDPIQQIRAPRHTKIEQKGDILVALASLVFAAACGLCLE